MQRRIGEKHSEKSVKRRDFGRNPSRIFAPQKHDGALRSQEQIGIMNLEFAELLYRFKVWDHHRKRLFDTVFACTKPANRLDIRSVHCKMEAA